MARLTITIIGIDCRTFVQNSLSRVHVVNFFIADIEDLKIPYPDPTSPEIKSRFKSLSEYHKIAKKVIRTFAPKFVGVKRTNEMIESEDCVSEIARLLMMADWGFKEGKGKTEYSWRNQRGKWAIQDCLDKFRTEANRENYSLDLDIDNGAGDFVSLSSIVEDKTEHGPTSQVDRIEAIDKKRKYVKFLIDNSDLTKVQRECLRLKFFDGVDSEVDIGKMMEPPISRQAVSQTIGRALHKLRQTAKGTAP